MVTTTDLLAYWPCYDNAANTTVEDVHASNDGTASANTSTIHSTDGKIDDCFDLEGSTPDYFEYPDIDNTTYSVGAWIKMESGGAVQTIMAKADGNAVGTISWLFRLNSDNKLALYHFPSITSAISSAALSTDTWYFVGATVNGSTGAAKLYINGSPDGTGTLSAYKVSNYTGTVGVQNENDEAQPFDGLVCEAFIFGRELSAQDFTDLWNSGDGLAYPFTEGPAVIEETDTTTLSDSLVSKSLLKRTLLDTSNLSDTLSNKSFLNRIFSDTTNLSDSLTALAVRASRLITASDTTILSDNITIDSIRQPRVFSAIDTTTLSDDLTIIKIGKNLISESDTTTLSDSLSIIRISDKLISVSDTTTLSDSLIINRSKHIELISETDTTNLSDDLTIICSRCPRFLNLSDTTTLSDDLDILSGDIIIIRSDVRKLYADDFIRKLTTNTGARK